jgi:hypothetical protein
MRRTFVALVVVAAVGGVAGCGSGGYHYKASTRENFMTSCEHEGARSRCECLLKRIEAEKSEDELAVAERAISSGATAGAPEWLIHDAEKCGGK